MPRWSAFTAANHLSLPSLLFPSPLLPLLSLLLNPITLLSTFFYSYHSPFPKLTSSHTRWAAQTPPLMATLYPYAPWGQPQTSVYFPSNIHRERLVNDAAHTIMAIFLPGAVDRDCTRIQNQLVQMHGGLRHHYRVTRCSRVRFFIALPEHLNRGAVMGALVPWANDNNIAFFLYDYTEPWKPTPIAFKVYIRVLNYPTEFWHHSYFNLLTAGFGEVLYADEANTLGRDRSTLRLSIKTHDPSLIPQTIILHCDNGWTRCCLTVIGWEANESDLPDGFEGPKTGGSMAEVNPEHEWSGLPNGGDEMLRRHMMDAHKDAMCRSPEQSDQGRRNVPIYLSQTMAGDGAPGPGNILIETKPKIAAGGIIEDDPAPGSCCVRAEMRTVKNVHVQRDLLWSRICGKISCTYYPCKSNFLKGVKCWHNHKKSWLKYKPQLEESRRCFPFSHSLWRSQLSHHQAIIIDPLQLASP